MGMRSSYIQLKSLVDKPVEWKLSLVSLYQVLRCLGVYIVVSQTWASFFSRTFLNFIFSGSNLTSDKIVNSHLKNFRHKSRCILETYPLPEDDF